MDPNATYSVVRDNTVDAVESAEAAMNLLAWLALGGFTPDGVERRRVVDDCVSAISRAFDA